MPGWVRTLVANAASLLGTAAVTSGLGFGYWVLAARLFEPAQVGLASAAISALALLGTLGTVGLGTVLMGELPRRPAEAGRLLRFGLLTAGGVAAALAGLASAAAGWAGGLLPAELAAVVASPGSAGLLVAGAALTAVTLVLDHALLGLLRGSVQLTRNAVFSVAKLATLWAAVALFGWDSAVHVIAAWVVGQLTSLMVLVLLRGPRRDAGAGVPAAAVTLRAWGPRAARHHALNLTEQAPRLVLPMLVVAVMSAEANAYFYTAWMIASLAFVLPASLATTLYPLSAAAPEDLRRNLRFTLRLSAAGGLAAVAVLWLAAELVLALFGPEYAANAAWTLRALVLGVVPLTVKEHYTAVMRVRDRVGRAALATSVGACLELSGALVGAALGGLPGLAVGWLAAVSLEAAWMAWHVARAGWGRAPRTRGPAGGGAVAPGVA